MSRDPMAQLSALMADSMLPERNSPPAEKLDSELESFIEWFKWSQRVVKLDPLLRAAITHLWFKTLDPFEQGSGVISQLLTDFTLAQADAESSHYYRLSTAMLKERATYHALLGQSQRGTMEITPWLEWFTQMVNLALDQALGQVGERLKKTVYWQQQSRTRLSREQTEIIEQLLMEGIASVNASEYQKITQVSKATATRHLKDLLDKGCIVKLSGGGRSTRYQLSKL
ncbi:MAG: Fic family protein [Gammaproteobacteria bacterium]|nr:Fic family protein [Gammaproteobacteria bacterium]